MPLQLIFTTLYIQQALTPPFLLHTHIFLDRSDMLVMDSPLCNGAHRGTLVALIAGPPVCGFTSDDSCLVMQ